MENFRIAVDDRELADLRDRLERTRWPDAETVDWSQGVPLEYLRSLCAYWADGYDWRAFEKRVNALPQYRTTIDGVGIHFAHVRSPHPGALPLVLTNGWSGSIVEYLDVIGPLTDPVAHGGSAADAFHVVLPTLPGYGFSDKPVSPGWDVQRIADAWAALMASLGYTRYGAHGSDWGNSITTAMGQQHPEVLAGIHVQPPIAAPDPATFSDLSPREREGAGRARRGGVAGVGLLGRAVDETADRRVRVGGLAGRVVLVDRGEVPLVGGLGQRPDATSCSTT
ncbi:epoxide hydrolase domain-containing protein [Amycolatopsis methanolica 239]|uniref:Epoxide hydrolase domain-containing protein n=1 Tax=Amycolatopsis methanolica 239 TaxID=1068978 RepID=A0A076MMQ3_AMYME|nr:epoxide hydrolase domain-containing protein [Amycolatopsis methanolica 239]